MLKHNTLRSVVARGLEPRGVGGKGQPRAANMRKLSWDDDLAEVAQAYLNTFICNFQIINRSSQITLELPLT